MRRTPRVRAFCVVPAPFKLQISLSCTILQCCVISWIFRLPASSFRICMANDLLLSSFRATVQSRGHDMVLSMTGQSTLWRNLSSLSDLQKAEIMDAACHPSNGLFGPAPSAPSFSPEQKMRVVNTFRNQKREIFDLCLPDKPQLCLPHPPRVQMLGPAW